MSSDKLPEVEFAGKLYDLLFYAGFGLWVACTIAWFFTSGAIAFFAGLVMFPGFLLLLMFAVFYIATFFKVLNYISGKNYVPGKHPYDWDDGDKAMFRWFMSRNKKPEQNQ